MALSKETEIWAWLKTNTAFPEEAIAGIMGNIQAESGCEPCRVQNDFSLDRQNSIDYATAVDGGVYTAWAKDARGWGLCQWTYYARKADLLSFCRQRGKSIADLNTQLEFMMHELASAEYSALYAKLLTCRDVATAAELFCRQFERPAETTKNVINRTNYGKGFMSAYAGTMPSMGDEDPNEWIRDEIAFLTEERDRLDERINYYKGRLAE